MKIIVIGSGISGMSAAIEAVRKGSEVILLSPYPSERSQSVMAAGGINAVLDELRDGDSILSHAYDTYKGGCFIEDVGDIEYFCSRAPGHIRWIEQMGVVFNRDNNHAISQRAFGGQSHKRTAYAGSSTGKQIVSALVQQCREYEISGKITRVLNLYFHSALIHEEKCYGVLMMHPLSGEVTAYYGDAVIIATGGQNKLFGKTTGTEICDGYAAARLFTQGVTLRNLEFIQYHPTTIESSHKKMLITEASRGEGGRLYYMKNNERCYFMEELYGERGNLMPRDVVSKCIYDCPSQVYLDISFLGEKLIHERLQEVYDLCMEYIGLDVTKESIPVSPSVHFFMGGIKVNRKHETNIANMYAVGECASIYHGANRLGGNSLLAAVHSGRVAAGSALEKLAVEKSNIEKSNIEKSNIEKSNIEKSNIESSNIDNQEKLLKSNPQVNTAEELFSDYIREVRSQMIIETESRSKYPAVYILNDIAKIMNRNLGITRNADDLTSGIEQIDFYLKILPSLKFDADVSIYVNMSLYYMATLAKAILLSACERKESRGAHNRSDYPESSEDYKKCSLAEYNEGNIRITFC